MTGVGAHRCDAAVPVSATRAYRPHSTEEVAMSTPDESAKGVKTLGIKLKPDAHAQLSFIAQLRNGTITDEILIAIAEHIARAKGDPELSSKAAEARAEIEREAAARQQAIATLFESGVEPPSAPTGLTEQATGNPRQSRRSPKGGEQASVIPFGFSR